MLNTSFTWLIEQQLLISGLLLTIVLLERFCLKLLSPSFVYKLVLVFPTALLIHNLPSALKPLQNSQISYYLISPDMPYLQSANWGWPYIYATISTALVIFAIVVHTRFVNALHLRPIKLKIQLSEHLPNTIFVSSFVKTPMVIGFIDSKLVLPAHFEKQFPADSLSLILEHESIHIQRKDNLSNAVSLLVTLLLWFNPLSWLAYGSFRRLQELSCDQHVLNNKTLEQHILYSKALVNCAAKSPTTLMAYSNYGDKNMILQRLTHIKHSSKSSTLAKGGLLLVAACMLSTLAIAKSPKQDEAQQGHVSPILRIDPTYPSHAAAQGLNGSVVLKYDITTAGTTSNISIVSSTPAGIFDREAKRALAQWQYTQSAQGYQEVLVQLDFVIAPEIATAAKVERIKVVK